MGALPLLEREHELARVEELVEAVVVGEPRLVVVEGPAGAGKSAILNQLAVRAGERGVRVLRATGLELERAYPFGVVRQLFEPVLYELEEGDRGEVFAGAAALAERLLSGGDSGSGGRSDDPGFALLHSLYWALVGLTDLGPLALVVDDVQWADLLSLRFLAFALKRSDGLPLLVALACRDVAAAERSEALTTVLSGSASVIRPAPLSGAAIRVLLAGAVERELDDEVVVEAEQLTEGNPLYVRELADWLSAVGEGAEDPLQVIRSAAPAAVARRAQATLARVDPPVAALARATAVLGHEVPLHRAAVLAGVEPAQASTCADILAGAGILSVGEPLRFRHPLVLEAVLESIEPRARARDHGRAAKLLIAAGEPPQRVAVHLLESDPASDPEVVATLRAAAGRAVAEGAPELAIRALRRALREPPLPAELPLVLGALAGLETLVGDPAAGEHFEQALTSGEPAAEGAPGLVETWVEGELEDVAVARTWLLLLQGRAEEAEALIDRVLAPITDRERRLRIEAELSAVLMAVTSGRARLDRVTEGLAGETPAERLLLGLHASQAWPAGTMLPSDAARLVHAALADRPVLGRLGPNSPTYAALVGTLGLLDELDEAEREIASALAEAHRRGTTAGLENAWVWRATIGWRRGQLVRAEADARTALEIGIQTGRLMLPFSILVNVLIERGELEQAESLLNDHDLLGPLVYGRLTRDLLGARARLRLTQGQTEQGIAELTEALAGLDADEDAGLRGRWAVSLVPALMQAGRVDQAREVADRALAMARRLGVPRYIARGLHACALADVDGLDPDRLREVIAVYEGIDASPELAHALTNLGTALRHRRQPAAAREPLRRALDLARACRARPLAERAEHELRAAGARPRRDRITGRDALTASEQRIAELAAEGMTNRQIAETLFITRKTVESHLEHIFRKLGIHARGEIARALAAENEIPTAA